MLSVQPPSPRLSRPPRPRRLLAASLSLLASALLAACGGSGGPLLPPPPTADAMGDTGADPIADVGPATCYDGKGGQVVAADDPLFIYSWHLKNTGAQQTVSAASNRGVAGMDANLEQVHKAGQGCTGKGVTIAIVDSALETGHEDLADNIVAGKSWSFASNTGNVNPAPQESETDHGTGVAGVAAARGWNGKGSRGTAPQASLVSYTLLADAPPAPGNHKNDMVFLSFGARGLADATAPLTSLFGDRADSTSIFNFSATTDYAAPPVVNDLAPIELAPRQGTRLLRGGRGAVYFQSAGNEFTAMEKAVRPDGTTMNVNCPEVLSADAATLGGTLSNPRGVSCGSANHEPHGKPYFYTVAALHNTGKASSYSSAAAANWITGFGGEYGTAEAAIVTTDNTGCSSGTHNLANRDSLLARVGAILHLLVADLFGANPNDPNCNYTGMFNGTSAAAPSVAGIAALMLEANPALTWQDVGYILAKTARKVDADIATGASRVSFTPTGSAVPWPLEDPWLRNAAGFNFQNRYGFGLVDADAAVRLALQHTAPAGRRAAPLVAVGAASSTTAQGPVGLNVATASFSGTGAVSGPMRLDVSVTNNTGRDINPGYLQFLLEGSATGTRSILLPAFTAWYVGGKEFPIRPGAVQSFRFHTNAFYGEPLGGTYKVTVIDLSGASATPGKTLDFTPTLTSFSL